MEEGAKWKCHKGRRDLHSVVVFLASKRPSSFGSTRSSLRNDVGGRCCGSEGCNQVTKGLHSKWCTGSTRGSKWMHNWFLTHLKYRKTTIQQSAQEAIQAKSRHDVKKNAKW